MLGSQLLIEHQKLFAYKNVLAATLSVVGKYHAVTGDQYVSIHIPLQERVVTSWTIFLTMQ